MNIINKLIDIKLLNISRICNLIKLDFETKDNQTICIHIQSALFRGLELGNLLITSNDIYVPSIQHKKSLKFKWDLPGNTLFDDQLLLFEKKVLGKKVISVDLKNKDLFIELQDNYRLEIIANTLENDTENFRVFIQGDINSHFVVENL